MQYICWPNRTFSRSEALQNHLTTHDKTKIYNCSECPKSFSCPAFLSRHVKIHIKVFYCNLCSTQCKSKYSLKRHVEKKHNNNESVNNLKTDCKYCGKEYYLQLSPTYNRFQCHCRQLLTILNINDAFHSGLFCIKHVLTIFNTIVHFTLFPAIHLIRIYKSLRNSRD